MSMAEFDWKILSVFLGILVIDLTLAIDNILVISTLAAKLPSQLKAKALWVSALASAFFRILFALFASSLMHILGLTLVGGLLLLWVAWKLWREIRGEKLRAAEANTLARPDAPRSQFSRAVIQLLLADASMSLDNTLAVAGAARNHPVAMVVGLIFSVGLVGLTANFISGLIEGYRWISYVGLVVILYVALNMIWEDTAKLFLGA